MNRDSRWPDLVFQAVHCNPNYHGHPLVLNTGSQGPKQDQSLFISPNIASYTNFPSAGEAQCLLFGDIPHHEIIEYVPWTIDFRLHLRFRNCSEVNFRDKVRVARIRTLDNGN